MKKQILFILFLFIIGNIRAQDVDIHFLNKNSNFIMPKVNKDMTYNEFQLLSRNLRVQDMLYAMVVPGYTHFVAKDNKTGKWLVGIRAVGYAGLASILLNSNHYSIASLISGVSVNKDNSNFKKQQIIVFSSVSIILGSYFYDWIHGKWELEKKQESIRFKYRLKVRLSLNKIAYRNNLYPGLMLSYKLN